MTREMTLMEDLTLMNSCSIHVKVRLWMTTSALAGSYSTKGSFEGHKMPNDLDIDEFLQETSEGDAFP